MCKPVLHLFSHKGARRLRAWGSEPHRIGSKFGTPYARSRGHTAPASVVDVSWPLLIPYALQRIPENDRLVFRRDVRIRKVGLENQENQIAAFRSVSLESPPGTGSSVTQPSPAPSHSLRARRCRRPDDVCARHLRLRQRRRRGSRGWELGIWGSRK